MEYAIVYISSSLCVYRLMLSAQRFQCIYGTYATITQHNHVCFGQTRLSRPGCVAPGSVTDIAPPMRSMRACSICVREFVPMECAWPGQVLYGHLHRALPRSHRRASYSVQSHSVFYLRPGMNTKATTSSSRSRATVALSSTSGRHLYYDANIHKRIADALARIFCFWLSARMCAVCGAWQVVRTLKMSRNCYSSTTTERPI